MLDIELIRRCPEWVKKGVCRVGGDPETVDDIIFLDETWRWLQTVCQQMKADSKQFAALARTEPKVRATMRERHDQIRHLEQSVREALADRDEAMLCLPNLPHRLCPFGDGPEDNIVVRYITERQERRCHEQYGTPLRQATAPKSA